MGRVKCLRRSDVAKCSEPPSEGRKTSDRPPNDHRAR